MENIKNIASASKRSFHFLENLEQRHLLSAGMEIEDDNGMLSFSYIADNTLHSDVCELPESTEWVLIEDDQNDDSVCVISEESGYGITDTARYLAVTVLRAMGTGNEDDAFVRAEGAATHEGGFPFNAGWLSAATISAVAEYVADEIAADEENNELGGSLDDRMESVKNFLITLPFGLVGLFIMQHASATTSVKYDIEINDITHEITTKPFTLWFVAGSLLGATIGMLPKLYQDLSSGKVVDVSPTLKAIHHDWETQPALEETYSSVNVYKLSALAAEIVFIGLTSMMENRAHEEGGVLVKSAKPFFMFAYNAQYHFNYGMLVLFETLGEICRDWYADQPAHEKSLGGVTLRMAGHYGYMTSVYFGSITSFYIPRDPSALVSYMMNVPRAVGIHMLGTFFNDGMNRLADWYESDMA